MADDPIPKFRRQLVANSTLSEAEADKIEADVKALVAQSIVLARAAPQPSPDSGLSNVFAGMAVSPSQFT